MTLEDFNNMRLGLVSDLLAMFATSNFDQVAHAIHLLSQPKLTIEWRPVLTAPTP